MQSCISAAGYSGSDFALGLEAGHLPAVGRLHNVGGCGELARSVCGYSWESRFHLGGGGPGGETADVIVIVHGVLAGFGIVGWVEVVHGRNGAMAKAEVSIARLHLVGGPGRVAFVGEVVIVDVF